MSIPAGFLAGPQAGPITMSQMVTRAGQASNLVLCLDVADGASYPGSGQTIADTSGSGNDFVLGTTSAVNAQDPTFVGVAGDLSENTYFSFGGTQVLEEASALAFADDWHHQNATFSFAAMLYLPISSRDAIVFSTGDAARTRLIARGSNATGSKRTAWMYTQAGGGDLAIHSPDYFIVENQWMFIGYVADEAAESFKFFCNGGWSRIASSYGYTGTATPSGAGYTIGGDEDRNVLYCLPNGSRLGGALAWRRTLAEADIEALYAQMRTRYSSLP